MIVSTPLTPLRVACQKACAPMPFGLTTPIPLTTTLRSETFPFSLFILTLGSGNSLISTNIASKNVLVKMPRLEEARL